MKKSGFCRLAVFLSVFLLSVMGSSLVVHADVITTGEILYSLVNNTGLIIGLVAGVVILTAVLIWVLFRRKRGA